MSEKLKHLKYINITAGQLSLHTRGGISGCGEGAAGCALRLAVSLKDLPVRVRSAWPGYSDIIITERSITAGHCCETSYFPKTQTTVTISGLFCSTLQSSSCVHDNNRSKCLGRRPVCKYDPRPTQTEDKSLLPGNPEQPWGSWGPMEIWVLLPSPWPALVLPETPTAKIRKHVSAHIVLQKTGSQYLLDQNRWTSGPGLCGRWVCPTGCCSWWCPPSLQRTSSPQRSSTAISWKAIWRHSEPGDGDLFTHFDTRSWKMIGWCLKQRTGERAAVVSETKDRLLCRRRGWEVEAPLGKWWAAGFSCRLAAVWCHPGRIPPSLRHRTSQSARKQTKKPLLNKFKKNTSL